MWRRPPRRRCCATPATPARCRTAFRRSRRPAGAPLTAPAAGRAGAPPSHPPCRGTATVPAGSRVAVPHRRPRCGETSEADPRQRPWAHARERARSPATAAGHPRPRGAPRDRWLRPVPGTSPVARRRPSTPQPGQTAPTLQRRSGFRPDLDGAPGRQPLVDRRDGAGRGVGSAGRRPGPGPLLVAGRRDQSSRLSRSRRTLISSSPATRWSSRRPRRPGRR